MYVVEDLTYPAGSVPTTRWQCNCFIFVSSLRCGACFHVALHRWRL